MIAKIPIIINGATQNKSSSVNGGTNKMIANIMNIIVSPIEIKRPAVAQPGLDDDASIWIGCQLDF